MKAILSIEERNSIVERELPLIDKVMEQHRNIIKAARMDRDDVFQQLAERLVKAVDSYVPEKGAMEDHLEIQLEREMFNCAHPRRLYGMTDAPIVFRRNRVISFDSLKEMVAEQEELAA